MGVNTMIDPKEYLENYNIKKKKIRKLLKYLNDPKSRRTLETLNIIQSSTPINTSFKNTIDELERWSERLLGLKN